MGDYMKMERRRLSDLRPAEYNPRVPLQPEDKEYQDIKCSIEENGYLDPIVINYDGTIIKGHQRRTVMMDLGIEEAKVVVLNIRDKGKEKQANIALNKITGRWDELKLRDLLLDLELNEYDLAATGFSTSELEDLCVDLEKDAEAEDDDFDPEEEYKKIDEPITRRGDIWILGRHRLMCGDSTSLTDVQKLVGGAQMDLLLTDPPYNVDYQGTAGKIKNDNMEDTAFRRFLTDAFSNAAMVMKPGAPFYIWHADSEGYNFRGACRDAMLRVRQCLIWVKNSLVMGRQDFQWKHEPCLYGESEIEEEAHEPCLYGWTEGKKHYFFKNRRQTTVLNFDKPVKSAEHPTMKPIKLFDYQMQCSSKPGENVLDLFAGSGTTIMAAEQNGRHAFCMEYDPKYADVIVDRWEKFTGKKAVLLND